jgi:hypothetical protein
MSNEAFLPLLGDTSLHFEDAQVLDALVGTEHLINNIRGLLNHMTTGEKWSLYRAIVKLANAREGKGK